MIFAKQEEYRECILFNNGLHGWHIEDETEYKVYFEEMIKFLMTEFKGTPLVIVLTTMVQNAARNIRVKMRNRAAKEIADKYGLPIADLYKLSVENSVLMREDGVHFTDEGSEILATEIVRICCETIGQAE